MAKRLDCPYKPGRRSPGWVKVKNVRRAEVVIGGWLPGEGSRGGRIGALLVGFYETTASCKLRRPRRHRLHRGRAQAARGPPRAARARRRARSPAASRPKESRFVEPELVCSVDYGEWTQAGTLRHPSYKGLRDDVDPADVTFDQQP